METNEIKIAKEIKTLGHTDKESKEFNRQRKLANLQILDVIKQTIENNDSIRFIQVLWALHIIDRNKDGIIDRFYEEPQETLKRILK